MAGRNCHSAMSPISNTLAKLNALFCLASGAKPARIGAVRACALAEQKRENSMAFIEMTGKTLEKIIADDELHMGDLAEAGVDDQTIVRVNRQGDIEVRRRDGWDVVGGLIGEFDDRIRHETGLNWSS